MSVICVPETLISPFKKKVEKLACVFDLSTTAAQYVYEEGKKSSTDL